jgi:MYXO-CTERM domain-containing protein
VDDHTVKSPFGALGDCAPFKCRGTACLAKCSSVDDCVTGLVCDPNGQCVQKPEVSVATPDSSCGCRVAGREPPSRLGALGFVSVLGLLATRRRRVRRAPRAAERHASSGVTRSGAISIP